MVCGAVVSASFLYKYFYWLYGALFLKLYVDIGFRRQQEH